MSFLFGYIAKKTRNGVNSVIIRLNPLSKSFNTLTNITKIGGDKNTNHVIYSIVNNTIRQNACVNPNIRAICLLRHRDMSIQFGKNDRNAGKCIDAFYVSSIQNNSLLDRTHLHQCILGLVNQNGQQQENVNNNNNDKNNEGIEGTYFIEK